ncbi:ABC transporter substrate-binding protein [Rosenbergiella nectarea]|uniref:ABC transporter substrate-binding protein n=1 Tax=Rosenbergiella nectarea TaxID=988801 RepID=UPI002023F6F9|nr:ABC transporter substrate-binding protein [Rosenbergiella nectarea]
MIKLKKLSRSLLSVIALTTILLPTAHAQPLLDNGVLKVGIEAGYPPFEAFDLNGQIVGIDPDFAQQIAKQMNVRLELIDTKFTSLILGLGKKYDMVISGMYITPARQQRTLAIPYMLSGASIISWKEGQHQPTNENELCGLTVGLQQGNAWNIDLAQHSVNYCQKQGLAPIKILEFPTVPEVSQALLSKNVDVQLEIDPAAQRIVKMSRGRLLISSTKLLYPLPMGIFVDKNNPQLASAIQDALTSMKNNGHYAAIMSKYRLASHP